VVWRFDRDGPKPRQVLPEKVATDMIFMMNKVAEEGTGRRALFDGVRIAGKTGTTNNYRDAWFVGYSANLVAGVWVGNDDYGSTNRMTGGSLPAMIWRAAMSYAHQGIEIKTLPGLPPAPAAPPRNQVAEKGAPAPPPPRPTVLTRRGTDVLVQIERLMEEASRALPAPSGEVSELPAKPGVGSPRSEALASATGGSASGAVRGN
jgi:penicillin-binding protein 1A